MIEFILIVLVGACAREFIRNINKKDNGQGKR